MSRTSPAPKKPLFIVRHLARRPCCVCALSAGLGILLSGIFGVGFIVGFVPLGIDLSADWMAVRDEQSDRLYYWNRRTGATSWEKPPPVRQATAGEADSQLADAFAEAFAEAALEPLGSADRLDTPSRRVVVVAPSEMRLVAAATELPSELKKSPGGTQRSPHESLAWRGGRAEPKWARESASLRDAFAASTRGGGTLLAPDDANDGRVECPHCKRRFKAAVAERHIPQCKGLKTKPRTVG